MTKPPPPSVFRRTFRLLPACAAACFVYSVCAALPSIALAKDGNPAAMPFDIPADVAARSLKVFAQQSGSEVIVGSDSDGRVHTRTVKGEMTPTAALDAMLAGTGLVADRHEKTGAYAIRKETDAEKNGQRAAPTAGDRPRSQDNTKPSNPQKL